jgi:hypothetical protein
MVDLMSLEEQVDREFTAARRRARIRGLRAKLRRSNGTRTLISFEEQRRSMRAVGGFRCGRATVELSRIVGSAGKHDWLDEGFMPLRALSRDRWKRIDRAFRLGRELPPVVLYKLGGLYFVTDGHHRVSVARFHDAEWIDAEITEFRSPADRTYPHSSVLVAGHETTVNLIASGMLTLIEQPEQLEELEADPQLIKPAVEELLRYTSPVEIATERYARHDLEVSDTEVPRGELVLAVLGSANHDEQYFDDPDTLDLAPSQQAPRLRAGRRSPLPRGATGQDGAQIAITALLQRFPDINLAVTPDSLRRRPGLFLRGLERLPVEF